TVLIRKKTALHEWDAHRSKVISAGHRVIRSRFLTGFVWGTALDLKTQLNVEISQRNIAGHRHIPDTRQCFHSPDELLERRRLQLGCFIRRSAERNVQSQHAFRIKPRIRLQQTPETMDQETRADEEHQR